MLVPPQPRDLKTPGICSVIAGKRTKRAEARAPACP